MLNTDLPVVTSCEGCGACCREQGAPPDYVALRLHPEFAADASFHEDSARLAMLSDEAGRLLEEYLRESAAGLRPTNGVCCWFEESTQGCRFYDERPSTCRVFEINSPGCHFYRRRHSLET